MKSNNPSNPLQLRDAQDFSRFFDDYLPDHPVHIPRLGHDTRLRIRVTPKFDYSAVIERVLSVTVEPPDADFNVVIGQRCRDDAVMMAMALLRPSNRCLRTLSEYNTGRGRIVVEDPRNNYFGSDEDVREWRRIMIEVPASHALFFCPAEDRHV